MLGAGLVVPGSAGFRYCGEHAWLNRFLFPVSRPAFLADLGRVSPDQRAEAMDPGDVVEMRSEEHTSELQSQSNLVCRLLLEKKKGNVNASTLLESIVSSIIRFNIEYGHRRNR